MASRFWEAKLHNKRRKRDKYILRHAFERSCPVGCCLPWQQWAVTQAHQRVPHHQGYLERPGNQRWRWNHWNQESEKRWNAITERNQRHFGLKRSQEGIYMTRTREEKPSGEASVKLESDENCEGAVKKDGQQGRLCLRGGENTKRGWRRVGPYAWLQFFQL